MTNATLVRAALTAATCALAAAAVAGCARTGAADPSGTGGLGAAPAAPPAAAPPAAAPPAADAANPTPGAPRPSRPAGPDPEPSHASTATASHRPSLSPSATGPRIVYFRIKQKPQCPQGTNVFPVPGVPVVIEWKVTGADQVKLSVDDPNRVGSYGTYATEATETFTFACSGAPNTVEKHTYTIYTVGGGAQRHKSITAEAKVYEISTV